MSIVAMSSTSVVNIDDGTGVASVEVTYAIGTSPTTPPGNPMVDGGSVIVDINGVPMTNASWQTGIPTVPQGSYLWTRTVTTYTSGDFAISYAVGYTGSDGANGPRGISITDEKEQWYLSNSNSSLTGGSWSDTEPQEIPDGKYLWGRWAFTMSDGSTQYSDAVYRSVIGGVVNLTDEINKKISQKIWSTDIETSVQQYDASVTQTIRDRMSDVEQDLNGITSRVSAAESSLTTKADGSTVTALQNTVTQNKQTADAFQQTVTSTYAKLTDVADQIGSIKIGGNNLYVIADEVPGYLNGDNTGAIAVQQAANKEITSDYIPVKAGSNYIIQSWCTPSSAGNSWLAYQFFSDNDPVTPVGNRIAKYGRDSNSGVETTADGQERLMYDVQAPEGATLLRVSYRSFNDGYAMVECATKPSEYSINSRDIEQYTDDAVESAKSEIKQTTDSISLEVSKKVGSSEIISKINQSPETVTISASKIDLIGNVTFNMLDTSTKNTITTLQSDVQTAQDMASPTLGMKVNYENFTNANGGECYIHGYTNNLAADVDGYVYWNGAKRTVPKKMLNPNTILPYWTTIYIVLRLSSASATTGTLYMVWYNAGWKYAITPTPSAVGGSWTWAETTDIVLGQFVEPSSEGQIVDAYLYDPPRNASQVQTTGNNSYQYAKSSVDWVGTNGSAVITAKSIVNNWATDATSATTTIKGGLIQAHTILTEALATNAIMSSNYVSGVAGSDTPTGYYSTAGSFLDLATGNFYTPNFSVKNANVYVNGEVNMLSGKIGDVGNSYWQVGTVYGEDWSDKAAIIAHGSALIQTAKLTLGDDKLSSFNGGDYIKEGNEWYDYGLQVPTRSSASTSNKQNFLYMRKIATEPSEATLDQDWTYLFRVDKDGNIYEGNMKLSDKYASVDGVTGAYLPLTGGTISGNLTVSGTLTAVASKASQLNTPRNLNVNLGLTTNSGKIAFNGTADVTMGVTGTLGVGNGGTGKSSWTQYGIVYATATNALGQMAVGTSGQVLTSKGSAAPAWTNQSDLSVGSATKATQDSDGNAINTTYRKLSNTDFTELSTGNLVVTGAATFTNGLNGDLTGDVTGDVVGNVSGSAGSVVNNLKIQLNSGTTEGTNQFTYNGSSAKNINITKSSVGLGNVENTAISTWAGSANLTTTKVGTLAAAAVKGVDTSISAASTSSNLPTSAAVASFVEGKGYVTSSGVTSVRVQATSPIVSSQNTAQSSTLNTTISLADGYGDTKNPYGTKTANYVLAGPSSGNAAAPSFRKLVAADIPSITKSKISDFPTTWELTNITGADDLKAIEGLTGTSGMLKKTAANTWSLVTVVSGFSVNNDKIIVTKSDGTTQELTINITGQVVSGATILSNSDGEGLNVGDASHPTYFSNGLPVQGNVIPTLTLNGSATTAASFYAPTGAGTSGQVLKSNGSGAPSWVNQSTLSVGSATSATTATKFSSARSIALTGDVTGSASTDGSSGWSIATTVADDSHNHTSETIVPIMSKIFTDVIGSANSWSGATFFFGSIKPDNWNDLWEIRYHIRTYVPGKDQYDMYADVMLSGSVDALRNYSSMNTVGTYYPAYYHELYRMKQAGFTNGYGHSLGVRFYSAYNATDTNYKRTIVVDVYSVKNCTFSFYGSCLLYASIPGTGSTNYNTYSEINYVSNGLQEQSDSNDVNYQNRMYYASSTAAETIYRYQLLLKTKDKQLLPVSSANNTFTIGKTYSSAKFDPFGEIYFYNATETVNTNANIGNSALYRQILADLRYSFDLDATENHELVARQPVYLVATPQSDGTAILTIPTGSIMPLTQTLPTTDDGLIYIYLGQAYEDTHPYRIDLQIHHPVYWYKNGAVRPYVDQASHAYTADSATTATSATNATNATTATTASRVSGVAGISSTNRHVWFSDSATETARNYDDDFMYNPSTNTLTVTNVSGTATKATQDGDGNTISSTYAKLSGATFTGAVTGTSFAASSYVCVNSGNSGIAGGLSLYATNPIQFGIAMRSTTNQAKHGFVQGDWATYFGMACTTATATTRGWVFYGGHTQVPVASISTAGNAAFNGEVAIGTTGTDISGSCSLVMNHDLDCLDFIFN